MWPFVSGLSLGMAPSGLVPGCLGAELSVTELLGQPSRGSWGSASSLRAQDSRQTAASLGSQALNKCGCRHRTRATALRLVGSRAPETAAVPVCVRGP